MEHVNALHKLGELGKIIRGPRAHLTNSLMRLSLLRIDAVDRLVCLGVCACRSWIDVCRQSILGRRNLCKDNIAGVGAFPAQDNYETRLPFSSNGIKLPVYPLLNSLSKRMVWPHSLHDATLLFSHLPFLILKYLLMLW